MENRFLKRLYSSFEGIKMNFKSKRNKKVLKVRKKDKSINLNLLYIILLRTLEKIDEFLEYLMK